MKYIIPILFLLSCSPEKKLNRLHNNHPDIVAKKTSQWFPCIAGGIDTLTTIDTIYQEYETIDTLQVIDTINTIKEKQTIYKYITQPVRIKEIVVTNTITKTITDSSKIYYLNSQIEKLSADNQKYQSKLRFWLIVCIGILSALVISLMAQIFKV